LTIGAEVTKFGIIKMQNYGNSITDLNQKKLRMLSVLLEDYKNKWQQQLDDLSTSGKKGKFAIKIFDFSLTTIRAISLLSLPDGYSVQSAILTRSLFEYSAKFYWAMRVDGGLERYIKECLDDDIKWANKAIKAGFLEDHAESIKESAESNMTKLNDFKQMPDMSSIIDDIYRKDIKDGYIVFDANKTYLEESFGKIVYSSVYTTLCRFVHSHVTSFDTLEQPLIELLISAISIAVGFLCNSYICFFSNSKKEEYNKISSILDSILKTS